MKYKEIKRETQFFIKTDVEYTFDDGTKTIVEGITHFIPKDEDAIIGGIKNRGLQLGREKNEKEELEKKPEQPKEITIEKEE